jgi:hypothetical protein
MLSKLIEKMSTYGLNNPAPFLRNTTAIIYAISTAAQTTGLQLNKDIPPAEKKFLMIQEVVNGVLELATFLTIATGFEKFGKKLAEKGVVIGSEIAKKNPAGFTRGMTMFFSIVGTIVAFNLVTPLIRNPLAAFLQKKMGGKHDKEQLSRPILPTLKVNPNLKIDATNPFSNFQNSMTSGKLPNRQYMAKPSFSSASMRI